MKLEKRYNVLVMIIGLMMISIGTLLDAQSISILLFKKIDYNIDFERKLLAYKAIILSAGFIIAFLSLYSLSRKHFKLLIVPMVIGFLIILKVQYFDKVYPINVTKNLNSFQKWLNAGLGNEILLSDFKPMPTLVNKNRPIYKSKFQAIDCHFHLADLKHMSAEQLVDSMDNLGIKKIINLDGYPHQFEKYKSEFVDKHPDRFVMFTIVNWFANSSNNFINEQIDYLRKTVGMGAKGLKIGKSFGLRVKDKNKNFLQIDNIEFDPIWKEVERLNLPVIMHTSDPSAFFEEFNNFNERIENLISSPENRYVELKTPTKEMLLEQRENLLKRYPKITFIGAHIGSNANDLGYVSSMLEKYQNYYVDMSAAINELGRQPFSSLKFFVKYQDRIMFGSDGGYGLGTRNWPPAKFYSLYFEFLETDNEYFNYPLWDLYSMGRWKIYGLNLQDEILKKIYHDNTARIILNR